MIPNLDVIRPADPEETAGAFVAALQRLDGPTGLILTRQISIYLKSQSLKGVMVFLRVDTSPERRGRRVGIDHFGFWK